MSNPWLRFFRVVNLPTVPGDVLVGAAAVVAFSEGGLSSCDLTSVALVSLASCCLYLFGLADNDIVGVATDRGRPVSDGEISPVAARLARGLCLGMGFLLLVAGGGRLIGALSIGFLIAAAAFAYNRTKWSVLMGLCRGLNVLLGATAIVPVAAMFSPSVSALAVAVAVLTWTLYIVAVTKYSEGEEADPSRRNRVGMLVGGIVYLQLVALIALAIVSPGVNVFLAAGAVLLLFLRILKIALPKVSAS